MWSKLSPILSRMFENYGGSGVGMLLAMGVTASILPDTIFVNRRRSIFAYVDDDEKEKVIGTDLQAQIDKVLYKIHLRPEDEANLDFFLSMTSDPVHYGSLKMRTGAVIGLPVSLEYRDDNSFKGESFSFQGIPFNVDGRKDVEGSDGGAPSTSLTDLKTSLLLTTPSKDFLIAREVNYTNSHHIHFLVSIKALLGLSTFTAFYLFDTNLKSGGRRLRGGVKVGVVCIMTAIASLLYISIKDANNCWLDYSSDKAASSLGKDYARGGVDYYNSLLLRNKTLRHLSKSGSSYFTSYGNEASTFRVKHMQLTTRRDNLLKWLGEYESGVVVEGGGGGKSGVNGGDRGMSIEDLTRDKKPLTGDKKPLTDDKKTLTDVKKSEKDDKKSETDDEIKV